MVNITGYNVSSVNRLMAIIHLPRRDDKPQDEKQREREKHKHNDRQPPTRPCTRPNDRAILPSNGGNKRTKAHNQHEQPYILNSKER